VPVETLLKTHAEKVRRHALTNYRLTKTGVMLRPSKHGEQGLCPRAFDGLRVTGPFALYYFIFRAARFKHSV